MNSPFFHREWPSDNAAFRQRLFAGDVFLTPPASAVQVLVNKAIALLENTLGTKDIRHAHEHCGDAELFEKLGGLRRTLYLEPEFHAAVRAVVASVGFDPQRVAFDPIRLRVVQSGGHRNPLAAPVYYPHRDTWYAHPQSLIVWWIPLHDLTPEETFVFYPEQFAIPVENDSEIFDYGEWIKDGPALKIGWQKRDSGVTARYPRATAKFLPEKAEGFSCRAAEQLIFAGAHYHRTLPQETGMIRYSLDFRVAHLDDVAAGRGAPNADNRSRGTTVPDYVQPVA